MTDVNFSQPLKQKDPEIFQVIEKETSRQIEGIELIASENYASQAVMEASGSVLTNKYAEGYPAKRYYGGCEFVDEAEVLAIKRLKKLFNAQAANVQPHSGSQANMAVYMAVLKPGDRILGMDLSHGGHLTHGSPVNFSGRLYQVNSYGLHPETHRIDYDQVRDTALKVKPKVIIAGASAYPRVIDFEAFGKIAQEVGAELVVDMAHIAGLVAAKLHPSPIEHAGYVTSTTHKTLRGPRGGIILSSEEKIKAVNKLIFPGIQGGPMMHTVAAKAVAFGEALTDDFVQYQKQTLTNSKALAEALMEKSVHLVTGGTDNHLVLLDLTQTGDGSVTGKEAENWLEAAGITANKNTVPQEKRSPFVTSGLRLGVPAITTRGMKENEMTQIAEWISVVINSKGDEQTLKTVKSQVFDLCKNFPIYES